MAMRTLPTVALRRLLLLLGLVVAVIVTPDSASAEKPRGKRPAAAASRRGASKPVAGRRSAARRGKSAAASRRTASRRGKSARTARRGRRVARHAVDLAPVIPNVANESFVTDSADRLRDSIVAIARKQIGTPYVWGAETPGRAFDCSGLVKYVMSWFNVSMPRTANEQAYAGIRIGRELDRMKPGDLLTFGTRNRITHIAIYSGNGRYVHASRPGVGVVESLLNTSAARFRGAVRLVADAADSTSERIPLNP